MPPDDIPDIIPSGGPESPRPQADPLQQGVIGYIEQPPTVILHTLNVHDPPQRHSVDRNLLSISPDAVIPPAQSEVVTCPSSDQLSSTASITKPNGMLDFFKPQGPPALGGLRLFTLVIFAVQLVLLGGTVTGWVFASKSLAITPEKKFQPPFGQLAVHIIFIVIVLVQLVLLERLFFRLRGERYNYVHRGETLPRHRDIPRSNMTSIFAPWNQPPLPTYAAALWESGVATGDVEDYIIAGPPPPAYDNTRGSTFVLRSSLSRESGTGRPQSHVSRDEQRDQVERERQLEEP